MKRNINRVAVLGSGIMGSRIACHFANIGLDVLLLDIAPKELTDAEVKKGQALSDTVVKNRIVNSSLEQAVKSKPAPLYHQTRRPHPLRAQGYDRKCGHRPSTLLDCAPQYSAAPLYAHNLDNT